MKPHNLLPIEALAFKADQFQSPSSEQLLVIHRASSALTTDPIQFWVSSVMTLDWWKGRGGGQRSRFLRESLCRPLTEAEFDALFANHAGGLINRLTTPLHRGPGFLGALQMADQWNEVAAMATWSDELIAFYWTTSA